MLATHSQIISQLGLAAGETGTGGVYLLQLVRRLLARAVKREQREFHFPSRAEELGPAPASPHITLLVTGVETRSCSVSLSILSAVRTPSETRMLGTGHFSLDLALDIDI